MFSGPGLLHFVSPWSSIGIRYKINALWPWPPAFNFSLYFYCVSASAEAQGCDTSDEEPADGLGGLYTWDWLDDAEAFGLGGDVQ